ncbi:hypothetical protein [Acidisoma cladoniae]|uniref:hypothetical protein n=1 Tax=Acidisoma cladoniae TaxID=3040935 RepID=UPI00254D6483|nr:hypothetical protein [Acidisoma sp. PAMC 29798]
MLLCFLLGVLLTGLLGLAQSRDVLDGALLDPDSYMRLVRLHDMVAAHATLQGVARDASGTGTVLAWSHLLDSILLLAAWPIGWFLSPEASLRWAGVLVGPLSVGLLCAAIAWATAPLTDRAWRWTTPLVAVSYAPIVDYGFPGVIHHHILLAVTSIMTLGWAFRATRGSASAGWRAGVWAAIGLWFSPETMPFTLMAFGALGLAWLTEGSARLAARSLRAMGSALVLLVALIVTIDPPQGGLWASQIDRVSIVYVWMGLACCGIGWVTWALDRTSLADTGRKALGGGLAVLLLGAWILGNPVLLLGPSGLLTPKQSHAFFGIISEMAPPDTVPELLSAALPGLLGAMVVLGMAMRHRTVLWGYAVACAIVVVALGLAHFRFDTYGAVLAAGALPVALSRLRVSTARARAALRMGVLAVFLLGPFAGLWAATGSDEDDDAVCSVQADIPLLAPFSGRVVLADVDDTPELLYRTGVLTVGSLYHTNIAAFMRLRAAWRSRASPVEPGAVRATGAVAILACPGAARAALVQDLPPVTLFDQLDQDQPPPWVTLVGRGADGSALYRIR